MAIGDRRRTMTSAMRTLLVIDAEGFSRHQDADLPGLHLEIRSAATAACERSGLGHSWQTAPVLQSTGDGLFAVLPLEATESLISPFPRHLQDALAEVAPRLRARRQQLRLRVALHYGRVDSEDPATAGISAATNEVHRLVDCEPLRDALRDSDPDVTFAAVIISAETFQTYVSGGHTELRPSQFTPVRARVKQFDRIAYLHVPVPSAREPGEPEAPASADQAPEAGAASSSFGNVSVTGKGAQNAIGNQVSGDLRQTRS
jgi:hypothetical protein